MKNKNNNEIYFMYLPFVRIIPEEEFKIGKALVFPDEDVYWLDKFNNTRPKFLSIFRKIKFNGSLKKERKKEDLLRGTIVTSDDWSWLVEHIESIISIIYFLGGNSEMDKTPAETFYWYPFVKTSAGNDEYVIIRNKKSQMLTSHDSIITPPMHLFHAPIGYVIDRSVYKSYTNIISLFDKNPYNEIVVASRYYFKTKYSDLLISPYTMDLVYIFAAFQALFQIEGHDIGKKIACELYKKFSELCNIYDWIKEAYDARSYIVHAGESYAQRYKPAFDKFKSTGISNNVFILSLILRKLIEEELKQYGPKDTVAQILSHVVVHSWESVEIERFFTSDEHWHEIWKELKQKNSIDTIINYEGENFVQFREKVVGFLQFHRWGYMKEKIKEELVIKAIKIVIRIILKSPPFHLFKEGYKDQADELYSLLDSPKANEDKIMGISDDFKIESINKFPPDWLELLPRLNPQKSFPLMIMALLVHLCVYFRPHLFLLNPYPIE
ncbi:hypothetical protein JXI42_07980 [bacterium]|nr:hypothetical protein [bacterium]